MKYKLNGTNNKTNIQETILQNRNITKEYLHLTDKVINNYSLLSNIDMAISCLLHHIEKSNNISIVVDGDP
jgi:single-stranded-DNA-specific exonuclease